MSRGVGMGRERGDREDAGEVYEMGDEFGLGNAGIYGKRREKERETKNESGEESMAV